MIGIEAFLINFICFIHLKLEKIPYNHSKENLTLS